MLLSASFGIGVQAAGNAPELADKPETVVEHKDGTYFGSLRLRVPVRKEIALAVLTDFENMERFIPNLSSSRIIQRSGNVYLVAQEGKADYGPLSYRFTSERRIEVHPDGRILARALAGTVKAMASELSKACTLMAMTAAWLARAELSSRLSEWHSR